MSVLVRSAVREDRLRILELQNKVFQKQQRSTGYERDESYWHWKYERNVFGKAKLFVGETNGQIVATGTLWPWEFILRGCIVRTYQACDTVVDPGYQRKGLLKEINLERIQFSRSQEVDLIFNFPNRNSLPGYLNLGWDFLGHIPWMVKILKPLDVLGSYIRPAQSLSLDIPGNYLLDPGGCHKTVEVHESYDRFLRVHRKPGFFDWRYLEHPSRKYGMIMLVQGYKTAVAIFTLSKKGSAKEMVVVDLIGSKDIFIDLIKRVVQEARNMEVSLIAVMQQHSLSVGTLLTMGFFKKMYKNMVCLPLDWGIEAKALNMQNWDLVAGMHDSI